MISAETKDLDPKEIYQYLIGSISPRPIAFVSTVSPEGVNNLAPFSFFNAFGANPPVIGFSPARRGSDGTQKDTYNNLIANKECVVHIVTYDIVEQMNLCSTEYEPGVDEFIKGGFTAIDSDIVQAKRVKESPVQMECKLVEMLHLGELPGSGNLALCEVVKFHIDERILKNTERGKRIDPHLLDAVGRNGQAYYTRAHGDAIFNVMRPINYQGAGYDQLPDYMKQSNNYTANNLGAFANVEKIPSEEETKTFLQEFEKPIIDDSFFDIKVKSMLLNDALCFEAYKQYEFKKDYKSMFACILYYKNQGKKLENLNDKLEGIAKMALKAQDMDFAWKVAASVPIIGEKELALV